MKKVMIVLGVVMVLISTIVLGFVKLGKETTEKALISPIFPTGIFLCKGLPKIGEGWANAQNFKYEPEWRQREIQKELEQLLANISEKTYRVTFQKNIRPDFDNEVTDVYFVPTIERVGKDDYMRLYGAILYEKEGYKGESQIICKYPQYTAGVFLTEHTKVEKGLKPSSVRPFQIGSFLTKDKGWKVALYEKTGLNKGFSGEAREIFYNLPDYFSYKEFNLAWSPRSLEIKGDLIAILMKPNGESETFFNETNGNPFSTFSTATKLIIISGKVIEKLN